MKGIRQRVLARTSPTKLVAAASTKRAGERLRVVRRDFGCRDTMTACSVYMGQGRLFGLIDQIRRTGFSFASGIRHPRVFDMRLIAVDWRNPMYGETLAIY
jgi:hypothetical protein